MEYKITTRNASEINVPDFAKLNVDGLVIMGDQTTDWNEVYSKNFLVLDKKIQTVETSLDTTVKTGEVYTKLEVDTIIENNQSGVSSWNDLTDKPTTIGTSGITDVYTKSQVDTAIAGFSSVSDFADLTNKPTTLSGYGITDAYTKTETYTKLEVNTLVATGGQTAADILAELPNI